MIQYIPERGNNTVKYSREAYQSLPEKAGVYVYADKQGEILYIGKAINLKSRVSSYFAKNAQLGTKTAVMVSQVETIDITIVETELEALLLEAFYIKKYNPKYNILMRDDKSYVRIKITIKDPYPTVMIDRHAEDPTALYYGPFPSTTAVKLVLKTIRRIFPYQAIKNHPKRICLYYHLGLCPCPPVFDSSSLKRTYKKNIRGIVRIFEGKSKTIMREMEKERDDYSRKENYEKALLMQRKIKALSLITTPFHKPFEYDKNPNLREDLRQEELNGLRDALNDHGLSLTQLGRIECYDISNIQGTNATASMVVFEQGEKASNQYRKFKIKREWDTRSEKDLPNDFAMMHEVLKRRLRHDDWHLPNLIIVDGGKGQVTSALAALDESGMQIPLVGLAKREETIVIPDNGDFIEVSLPKRSPSLHLLQRIRDEAHRFAITYHRKLRSKATFT
jgi:excinuclease ABC subunit C